MPQLFEPYRPSGSISPRLLIALPTVWLLNTLLAVGYAFAVWYTPIDKLRVFEWLLFGAGVGFFWGAAIQPAKIRNTGVVLFGGVVLAFWALYLQWVVWICIVTGYIVVLPHHVWAVMLAINEVGAWGHGNVPVKGTELWVFWIGEAVGVMLIGVLLPWSIFKSAAFCETCRTWANKVNPLDFKAIPDLTNFKKQLKAGDPAFMDSLVLGSADDMESIRFGFRNCTHCTHSAFLKVSQIKLVMVKGKLQPQETVLLPLTHVDGELYESLKSLAEPVPAPAEAAPAEAASTEATPAEASTDAPTPELASGSPATDTAVDPAYASPQNAAGVEKQPDGAAG